MGQHTLLHGEALLVVASADAHHGISSHLCGHTLLVEGSQLALIIHFNQLLTASGRKRDIQLRETYIDQCVVY
uniref:Uncharacterized protein n=1 Tax=Oncorhynchus kisutch TaxID=8019 RepID=A0A8C7HD04_ONCKI